MPLFKHFSKPKRQLEVTPRAAYTYDLDKDNDSAPSELVYPNLQPYVDRGSLLASVLNESLANVLDRLGSYSYNANLAAIPKLLTLYSDKNPDKCMFATPHLVATISGSSGVTWGWSQDHSKHDPVNRSIRSTGQRDGVRELREAELKFPPNWPPKGKKVKNETMAVLAHQIGVAAIGVRLGQRQGGLMARHSSGATMSSYATYTSSEDNESIRRPETPRSFGMPGTPVSPGMPVTPTTPMTGFTPLTGDAAQLSPYFVAPRGNNYAVFLLDFGPSILRTRKSLVEVAPSIRRLLSNGPPVRDQREAFRGLAQGMAWMCEESTTFIVQPSSSAISIKDYDSYKSAHSDDNLQTTMHITDGTSSLDLKFDYSGRMTAIKMDLNG